MKASAVTEQDKTAVNFAAIGPVASSASPVGLPLNSFEMREMQANRCLFVGQ